MELHLWTHRLALACKYTANYNPSYRGNLGYHCGWKHSWQKWVSQNARGWRKRKRIWVWKKTKQDIKNSWKAFTSKTSQIPWLSNLLLNRLPQLLRKYYFEVWAAETDSLTRMGGKMYFFLSFWTTFTALKCNASFPAFSLLLPFLRSQQNDLSKCQVSKRMYCSVFFFPALLRYN